MTLDPAPVSKLPSESPVTPLRAMSAICLIGLCLVAWYVVRAPTREGGPYPVPAAFSRLSLSGLHLTGRAAAPIAMVVFSDFECPACGRFARETMPAIVARFVTPGQLQIAFSDFPLQAIHPRALRRSAVAECAGRQGRFWETHDFLFQHQSSPSVERDSVEGLQPDALAACLPDAERVVLEKAAVAQKLDVRSTPTIVIGSLSNGVLDASDVLIGSQTVGSLSALLTRRLKP